MPKTTTRINFSSLWIRFLISSLVLFISFIVFYYVLREIKFINDLYVDVLNHFATFLLTSSQTFTELFGFEVTIYGKTIRIIDGLKAHGVYLDRGCMGRNVMLGFIGFIIAFPGKIKDKFWYIPLGLIILIFVNILRISGLAIVAYCCPEYSDVNHHIIFKYTAWAVILILWIIWINKFSPVKLKKSKDKMPID